MRSRFSKFFGFIFAILFSGLLLWFMFSFVQFFSGASDNIKAASITAIVSVSIFAIGRYTEQRKDSKQRQNLERIVIYKKFTDLYFSLFSHEKLTGNKIDGEDVLRGLIEFQQDVVFWGSDNVIKSYIEFKNAFQNISTDPENINLEKLAIVQALFGRLLIAMRKDIGYPFTSISAYDLAKMQLSDDPETRKLMEAIRKRF